MALILALVLALVLKFSGANFRANFGANSGANFGANFEIPKKRYVLNTYSKDLIYCDIAIWFVGKFVLKIY